jgi:hypothetical protein
MENKAKNERRQTTRDIPTSEARSAAPHAFEPIRLTQRNESARACATVSAATLMVQSQPIGEVAMTTSSNQAWFGWSLSPLGSVAADR